MHALVWFSCSGEKNINYWFKNEALRTGRARKGVKCWCEVLHNEKHKYMGNNGRVMGTCSATGLCQVSGFGISRVEASGCLSVFICVVIKSFLSFFNAALSFAMSDRRSCIYALPFKARWFFYVPPGLKLKKKLNCWRFCGNSQQLCVVGSTIQTHCWVFEATMVTRTPHIGRLYVHCQSY